MNRKRMLIAGSIAVLVGLVASGFVYNQMKQATTAEKPAIEMGEMVVAAMRLPIGTRLEPKHLRLIPWPAKESITGMFQRIEDCVGRALITMVVDNEPILDGKLAPKEAGAGLPATIPQGMRALTVAVNEVVGVAGFVMPGTMVDVLVTGTITGRGGQSITHTILENVRVLAAGQAVEQDEEGKPQTVPVVTLLVDPEEATKLTMASTEGRIQLALRNTIDTVETKPPPFYRASLFRRPAPPRRASAPPRQNVSYTVEVIRGTVRETKTF